MTDEPYLIEYIRGSYKVNATGDYLTMFKSPEEWCSLLGDTAIVFPLLTKKPDEKPIFLGGLIIGNPAVRLTAKDAEVSMMFVDLLSSSIYNASLVRKLNRMATTDALTGLYNRRHFLTEMEKAVAHTTRNSQPLSIAILDIDHFKKFNDRYGHLCGDLVLKETGELLLDSVRKKVDIPARYGGEEFVIIMPYTRIDQALFVSERIRKTMEGKAFFIDGRDCRVTCSIGIAEYIPGENYNTLIDRADAALYHAKNIGRNQVAALAADEAGDAP